MDYTIEQRAYAAAWAIAYDNLHESQRQFKRKFPGVSPPDHKRIQRWKDKLIATGSLVKQKVGQGRPVSTTGEGSSSLVLEAISENPETSVRKLSTTLGIPKSSVHRIITQSPLRAWKPRLHQELYDGDPDRRVEFANFMLQKINADPNFMQRIVFSDEATFHTSGLVNRHNCYYYSVEDPQIVFGKPAQSPSLTVWVALDYTGICASHIMPETMNGDRYLKVLEDKVWPFFRHRPQKIFQQDGASPHYAVTVRAYLDKKLPSRWIGRRGNFCEFPPRSPDLTACDYWFWGYLRDQVYRHTIADREHLENILKIEMSKISSEMFEKSVESFKSRCEDCIAKDGLYFE